MVQSGWHHGYTAIHMSTEPRAHIGAAARAMHNMGLDRLALVAPEHFPHPEARMMACHAEHLLHQAVVYDSLAAAVATCHWLVGTSARRREYRHPPLTPRPLAHKLPALYCAASARRYSLWAGGYGAYNSRA